MYITIGIVLIAAGYFLGFRNKESKPPAKIVGALLIFFGASFIFRIVVLGFFNWLEHY